MRVTDFLLLVCTNENHRTVICPDGLKVHVTLKSEMQRLFMDHLQPWYKGYLWECIFLINLQLFNVCLFGPRHKSSLQILLLSFTLTSTFSITCTGNQTISSSLTWVLHTIMVEVVRALSSFAVWSASASEGSRKQKHTLIQGRTSASSCSSCWILCPALLADPPFLYIIDAILKCWHVDITPFSSIRYVHHLSNITPPRLVDRISF